MTAVNEMALKARWLMLGLATEHLRPFFHRSAGHRHAAAYLARLLSEGPRNSSTLITNAADDKQPRPVQRVLDRSVWDADAARDALRSFVARRFADDRGVLVIEETRFLKRGSGSVGVKWQAGETPHGIKAASNCQIGLFLGYLSQKGAAYVDCVLYLPPEWSMDPVRRARAGVPGDAAYRTRPDLACRMAERAFDAGLPAAWLTGGEDYGGAAGLRLSLEARHQPYILAISGRERPFRPDEQVGAPRAETLEELAVSRAADEWTTLDQEEWAILDQDDARPFDWQRTFVAQRPEPARRNVPNRYYVVYGPVPSGLSLDVAEFERIRTVTQARQQVKALLWRAGTDAGLDRYEVRSWDGWYRHMTLALWALVTLATAEQATETDSNTISFS